MLPPSGTPFRMESAGGAGPRTGRSSTAVVKAHDWVSHMKVLIAGGAGYIGSTVASACVDQNIIPIILDNLSTGRSEFVKDRDFFFGDIGDPRAVARVFHDHPDIDVAVHAAALIAVPDSVARPMEYYRENVAKTLSFVE